jgi:hypothetical protein
MTRRGGGNPKIRRARAVNAEPWEPLPGMVKKQCIQCEFWYATDRRGQELCHDCEDRSRRNRIYGQPRSVD